MVSVRHSEHRYSKQSDITALLERYLLSRPTVRHNKQLLFNQSMGRKVFVSIGDIKRYNNMHILYD